MKTLRSLLRRPVPALCAAALFCAEVSAAPLPPVAGLMPEAEPPLMMAQADCYSVGQRVAAQSGGRLSQARQSEQGGQSVCVIVVIVPAKAGKRGRKIEVVVPN